MYALPAGHRTFVGPEAILYTVAVLEYARWLVEKPGHPILVHANERFGKLKADSQLCCLSNLTDALLKDTPDLRLFTWSNATLDAVMGWISFRVLEEVEYQKVGESDSHKWRKRLIDTWNYMGGPFPIELDSTNVKQWEKLLNNVASLWLWDAAHLKQSAISGSYPDMNPISIKLSRKHLLEDLKTFVEKV